MKFLHTMLRVADLDAALSFWCDQLGLVEISRAENPAGRFTLVFLAAPDDERRGRAEKSPLLELTWNWPDDGKIAEPYSIGRSFGHLAFLVDDVRDLRAVDGGRRRHQPASARRPHGLHPLA